MEEAALRKLIRATLGLAFVAAFSLANTINAASIVEFSQATPGTGTIRSVNAGNNTTLSTLAPTSVDVGKVAEQPAPAGLQYIETFSFTSTTPPSGADGNMMQGGFGNAVGSGTFTYTLNGVTQVAGTATNGILQTITNGAGGTTVNFNTSNVTFTTIAAPILQQAFGTSNIPLSSLIGTYQLTLTPNPNPTSSLTFFASAGGIITAQVVPEPASVVMASMALVAGLGVAGVRRIKASRA